MMMINPCFPLFNKNVWSALFLRNFYILLDELTQEFLQAINKTFRRFLKLSCQLWLSGHSRSKFLSSR